MTPQDVMKQTYPKGKRVRLIEVRRSHISLPVGMCGYVSYVDQSGYVYVRWDNGDWLGINPKIDTIQIIQE